MAPRRPRSPPQRPVACLRTPRASLGVLCLRQARRSAACVARRRHTPARSGTPSCTPHSCAPHCVRASAAGTPGARSGSSPSTRTGGTAGQGHCPRPACRCGTRAHPTPRRCSQRAPPRVPRPPSPSPPLPPPHALRRRSSPPPRSQQQEQRPRVGGVGGATRRCSPAKKTTHGCVGSPPPHAAPRRAARAPARGASGLVPLRRCQGRGEQNGRL